MRKDRANEYPRFCGVVKMMDPEVLLGGFTLVSVVFVALASVFGLR